MADSLTAAPWTGVVVDADNAEPWASPPIDPRTGQPMTDDNSADYLAEALALVRGALKTQGWSLVAHNPPITDPDEGQIGSTDAVLTRRASRAPIPPPGPRSTATSRWRSTAMSACGSTTARRPPQSERVFGFASYLLVADGPYSAYSPTTVDDPLYRVRAGQARPPTRRRSDGAFVRTFDQGAVAVNPGTSPVTVDLGSLGTVALEPGAGGRRDTDRTYR